MPTHPIVEITAKPEQLLDLRALICGNLDQKP